MEAVIVSLGAAPVDLTRWTRPVCATEDIRVVSGRPGEGTAPSPPGTSTRGVNPLTRLSCLGHKLTVSTQSVRRKAEDQSEHLVHECSYISPGELAANVLLQTQLSDGSCPLSLQPWWTETGSGGRSLLDTCRGHHHVARLVIRSVEAAGTLAPVGKE